MLPVWGVTMDLESLIGAHARGDSRAFEQIHNQYKDALWRYLAHRTRSTEDTKDLFNIVAYEVSRLIVQLEQPKKLRSWVCAIAERRLKHYYHREPKTGETLDVIEGLAGVDPSPEEHLARRQHLLQVRGSMLKLRDPERTICAQFYLGQVPIKEIALTMEMPVNTVKSHLRRARIALVDRLGARTYA